MANPLPDLDPETEQRIERIRSFNRMYMHRIGVLAEKIFGSSFSLAEVRVLNELCFRKAVTASILCRDLRMDGGYISRILQGFVPAYESTVTANLRDFPRRALAPVGLRAIHPDEFLRDLCLRAPETVLAAVQATEARARAAGGDMTRKELMRRARLPRLAKAMARLDATETAPFPLHGATPREQD